MNYQNQIYDNFLMSFKKTTWDECVKQSIFNNIQESELENIQKIFEDTIENHKTQILQTQGNEQIVNLILADMKREVDSKQIMTRDQIKNASKTNFENDLKNKQNEYTEFMKKDIPETPNFSDQLDEPLTTDKIDGLIEEQIKNRKLEINNIPITEEKNTITETHPLHLSSFDNNSQSINANDNQEILHYLENSSEKTSEILKELNLLKIIVNKQNIILDKIVNSQILLLKK